MLWLRQLQLPLPEWVQANDQVFSPWFLFFSEFSVNLFREIKYVLLDFSTSPLHNLFYVQYLLLRGSKSQGAIFLVHFCTLNKT